MVFLGDCLQFLSRAQERTQIDQFGATENFVFWFVKNYIFHVQILIHLKQKYNLFHVHDQGHFFRQGLRILFCP